MGLSAILVLGLPLVRLVCFDLIWACFRLSFWMFDCFCLFVDLLSCGCLGC